MNKMIEINTAELDNVTGGTAAGFRRYANPGSGWSVDLLKGGKAQVTTPWGSQKQIHIVPKGTHR
jgi:hypothetical protein